MIYIFYIYIYNEEMKAEKKYVFFSLQILVLLYLHQMLLIYLIIMDIYVFKIHSAISPITL